jgi:hypothetical protein
VVLRLGIEVRGFGVLGMELKDGACRVSGVGCRVSGGEGKLCEAERGKERGFSPKGLDIS